ncbi:uncharacterized protein VICG_00217 [Vittaforma corneae ATCC 50505]|uniref:Ubiquitin fusion degradation protein UFD1 n=1 Tax=Vittaforma corneae (strain ATCC 50505) TaxID=993615 RepID=L2GRE6_VITCO|nr:uncharacterized protein VICG_00217 [Vittaforma corneae ATCC 50505]ELA42902.1 hypothetical protein VICG_00217 [Vittaforma corneae ATCC 50505]
MFSYFFRSDSQSSDWALKPSKYPKNSENNYTSKVLLPHYVLKDLVAFNIQPPYVFEISHENGIYKTVCSVLDFLLDDDEVVVPSWMFEQLCLDTADKVFLKQIEIEKGEGVKLLPHSVEFLELENHKKELEKTLTNYHVLSYGDEILLYFEEIGKCRFTVTKIYPEHLDVIYIVDTDLKVDFDEPLGYKEKIESEKTVMKYVVVGNDDQPIKSLNMKKPGLFFGWDNLRNSNEKTE